ncbi:BON domain-containing protein [Janthinobacterium sp. HLX7-2]|uniref:BON domain-containing protein n=1 Tax=Janthinobacterium sp. HLX7-2 TaxID=1259331 RepID=UPI003F225659
MKYMPKEIVWVAFLACIGSAWASDQDPAKMNERPASTSPAMIDADNTKLNARDAGNAEVTPQAQSNAKADREVLAAVRKSIVKDKSLSTYAHNVKIHFSAGVVTLRGPVKSDDEKNKLSALAKSVAGVSAVDNQVDVKTH